MDSHDLEPKTTKTRAIVGIALSVAGLTAVAVLPAACDDATDTTSSGATTSSTASTGTGSMLEALDCDVAIVGGGAGGLHTAFRLSKDLKEKVCLFEKESELGGRIHDVPKDETDPNSPRFGTGARRVMEGQTVLLDLATELGLTLETPTPTQDLVNARGRFAFAKDDLLPGYGIMSPTLPDEETFLYDTIRLGPARANVGNYPELRSYIRDTVGSEEFEFLHDMSRFRADFEYPLDARGYMDYLDEEWDVCCTPSYPVGGMSAFIRGMEAATKTNGAKIFLSEPVLDVSRAKDGGYTLTTGAHAVSAKKVVIAAPPVGVNHITGDVIDDLKAQKQYQQIIGVKVVTVTQWWPTDWWTQIVNPGAAMDAQVWRAWTTEHCLNFIEIPLEPYAVAQKVTRSVYDDDRNCVDFWEALNNEGGTEAVEEEIQRGLEHLFVSNGITMPASVTIPKPTKTHVQVWEAAWHWLVANSDFTNADIFAWAKEPLPGEDVALVGEAYNPQRSGWSDGAYKSSINLLNSKYGFTLPGLTPPAPKVIGSPKKARHGGGLH